MFFQPFNTIGLMTLVAFIQVSESSWLVQSVDQCPVLPEIVEGEIGGGVGGECEIVEGVEGMGGV